MSRFPKIADVFDVIESNLMDRDRRLKERKKISLILMKYTLNVLDDIYQGIPEAKFREISLTFLKRLHLGTFEFCRFSFLDIKLLCPFLG